MRALGLAILVSASPAGVPLPERGTIVFLGDSITWQNLYVRYVEALLLRAYPERDLTVVNRGVRGDTAGDALARIDRDVVVYHPALVVIMLGVNDSGLGPPSGVRLSRYLRNMERLVQALREDTGAELLLLTPTSLDPGRDELRGANEMLATMSRELLALGARLGVEVLDIHEPFAAAARDSSIMADPLHPGPEGHAVIARELLAPWVEGAGLELQLDACRPNGTPFTLSHGHRNAFVPARVASLDAYVMRVGDAACTLELVVDGQVIGRFDAAQWKRGVDLNLLPNAPWTREAQRVDRLLEEKWRWSYVLWDPKGLGVDAAELVGGWWSGSEVELRAHAARELVQIRAELRAARSLVPVSYPARLRPPER